MCQRRIAATGGDAVLGGDVCDRRILEHLVGASERAPRLDELVRSVDEMEVDVVEAHTCHRFLDGRARLVVLVVASGQPRGDDDLFAWHVGFAGIALPTTPSFS